MGQYRYTYTSEMDPEGNILYVNNAPDIYVLSQFEISTIYQQIFAEFYQFQIGQLLPLFEAARKFDTYHQRDFKLH